VEGEGRGQWVGTGPAPRVGAENGGQNCVIKHQAAKGMSKQHAVMVFLAWLSSSHSQLFNGCQNAVPRRDLPACGLAAPKGEEFQARRGQILAAPGNVNTDDIDLAPGKFRITRNGIQKMLEAAHVAGNGVVLPAVDINEEKRTL